MNYECHITVPTGHANTAERIATTLRCKTSEIARDPVLGNKNFYYLTTHENDIFEIIARMGRCLEMLSAAEVPVLREKIELIIHDVRHKV